MQRASCIPLIPFVPCSVLPPEGAPRGMEPRVYELQQAKHSGGQVPISRLLSVGPCSTGESHWVGKRAIIPTWAPCRWFQQMQGRCAQMPLFVTDRRRPPRPPAPPSPPSSPTPQILSSARKGHVSSPAGKVLPSAHLPGAPAESTPTRNQPLLLMTNPGRLGNERSLAHLWSSCAPE